MKKLEVVVRVTTQYDETENEEQDIETYLVSNLENAGFEAEVIEDKEKGVKVEKHPAPYGYPFNLGNCPVCLYQLDEGDLFCRQCGNKLIWD